MADEKKDQVLYRPDLEPERHYLSDDIFQKSKVPNVPISEEDIPDIEETTEEEELKKARGIKQNATSTSTSVVPQKLKQEFEEVKELIPLLPEEVHFLEPTIEKIITRIDVQWPTGEYTEKVPIEYVPKNEIPEEINYIGHIPQENNPYLQDLPDLFPKPANVVIALETPKTLVDIVKETYAKDQVELETYYLQQLQIIMQKYFQQMLTIVADAGAMSIDDLTQDFDGDEVQVPEGQGLEHLRDFVVRSQISRDQMSRLFKKTHSVDKTMMHMRSWHAAELQRERYYGEEYKDSTSYCDSHSNSLLREARSGYNSAYSSAFYDMFKYLNSSTILTSDILNATVKEAQAKAELMKNGVDIYARNLEDQEIEQMMNDAGQLGDGSSSAEVINGADAYNTQTGGSSDGSKTEDASGGSSGSSGSSSDSSSEKSSDGDSFKDGDSDIEAANGTHFSKNDIDYLKSQGYSEQDAINELNKVDKYSKKVNKKSGGSYSYADGSSSSSGKKSSGGFLGKITGALGGVGGGFGGAINDIVNGELDSKNLGKAALNLGLNYASKHLGGGLKGNLGRAAINAVTGQTGNHEGGSFMENFVSGIQVGGASVGDIVSGVKNIGKGNMSDEDYINLATDVAIGVFDKRKRGAIIQDITKQSSSGSPFTGNSKYTAPNGKKIKQNDIDYLVKQGYSESDAVAYLNTCDKYSAKSSYTATSKRKKGDSDYVSPNGKYIKQNDIDYLVKQGYSTKDAVDFLNTQDTYKTPQTKNHSSKYSHYKAPNGRHIQWNDINYLIKQGYSEESAVEYLKTADKYKAEEPKRNSSKDNDKNKGESSSSSSSSSGTSSSKSSSSSASTKTDSNTSDAKKTSEEKSFKLPEVKQPAAPHVTENQRKVIQEAHRQKEDSEDKIAKCKTEIDAIYDARDKAIENGKYKKLWDQSFQRLQDYKKQIAAEANAATMESPYSKKRWAPSEVGIGNGRYVSVLEKYTSFRAIKYREILQVEKTYSAAASNEAITIDREYDQKKETIIKKYGEDVYIAMCNRYRNR